MFEFIMPVSYASKIDQKRLETVAKESIKQATEETNPTFSLRITNNQGIRQFNHKYRGINEATDVLSFPGGYEDPESGHYYLGDIIISLQMAQKQANDIQTNLQFEIEMLLVHGILHLCGYDHATKNKYVEMSQLQDSILLSLNNPLLGSIN